jgi:hypothetical protein
LSSVLLNFWKKFLKYFMQKIESTNFKLLKAN